MGHLGARALTNCPPRLKIASCLWASETLKHVDSVWHKRTQGSRFQQAEIKPRVVRNPWLCRPPSRGHSLKAAQAQLKSCYQIKEILGQGGMGVAYRAYDTVVRRDLHGA